MFLPTIKKVSKWMESVLDNSEGTNIQGPIQVTTPALGLFQVSDWTGSISVAHTGTVTTVAGNSPEVLYAGTVAANTSN